MSIIDGWLHRLRVRLRPRAYARELEEELRFHLETEAMQREHAGARTSDALDGAHRQLGNVTAIREEVRSMSSIGVFEILTRELRLAARTLRTSPAFALVTLATMALGVGATTAVFAVVNSVVLRPLPFDQPDRLLGLWHTAPKLGFDEVEQSDGTYLLYKDGNRSFEGIGAYQRGAVNLVQHDQPQRVTTTWITASLLPVLRVAPVHGRGFSEAEDKPGAAPVALISEGLWRSSFGANPAAIGQRVLVDGVAHEVIGVLPESFRFPDADTQLWLPLAIDAAHPNAYSFDYDALGRLKPGVTMEQAQRDLQRLFNTMPDRYPGPLSRAGFEQAGISVTLRPLRDDVVGSIERVLWVVFATSALVLLIGCANVANLFLVRAESRQKEMAVRAALGAGRPQLVQHALGESLVLSLAGGALGCILAVIGVRALVRLGPSSLPRLSEIAVDGRVVAVAFAASALAGLLFSILPVSRYAKLALASLIKEGGRGMTVGRERNHARRALVIAQVALALVLVAGSGLMMRSFIELRHLDPGFESNRLLTLRLALPDSQYTDADGRARFFGQLVDRVRAVSGVQSASMVRKLPLRDEGHNNGPIEIEEFPTTPGQLPLVQERNMVTEGYFHSMGIPLLAGRDFESRERERGATSVVVSQAFARRFWQGNAALGKRVRPFTSAPWYTIVGIVGNVRGATLEQPPEAMVYFPLSGAADDTNTTAAHSMSLVVRTSGNPLAAVAAIRQEVRALDAGLPLFNVQPMGDVVRSAMARTMFTLVMLGIASGIALILGAVGIYGVISYVVGLRAREIGVRMALGAQVGDVRWQVTKEGMLLALVGVGVGLAGALAVTRLLRTLLFGVAPSDPITLIGAAATMVLVAAVASAVPAWRASRMDPMRVLRGE